MRLILLSALVLTGCYTYVPLEDASLREGSRVRAHLSETGTRELASYLGRDIESVDGTVFRARADSVGLAVRSVLTRHRVEQYWNGEGVSLPTDVVTRLEERRLSRTRTAVFAGGLVLGSVLLRTLFDIGGGDDEGTIPIYPPVQH